MGEESFMGEGKEEEQFRLATEGRYSNFIVELHASTDLVRRDS